MSPAQRRRRDVLLVLMVAAVVTLLVALVTRSMPAIALHLLVDAALGGYVYLLLQHKQQRSQRSVRALRHTPRVAGPYAPYPTVDLIALDHRDAGRPGPRLVPLRQTVPS